jgi:hypothetical protein
MAIPVYHLDMEQGATFEETFQILDAGKFMAPIDDVEVGYPTILRVTAHGLNSRSPHPVFISGANPFEHLNATDTEVALCTRIDDDRFSVPRTTVGEEWEGGTGEVTYFLPADFTGYEAELNIRKNWHSDTIIHTASTANGQLALFSEDGSIEIAIPSDVTAAFTFVNAVFDIDLLIPGDPAYINRVIRGHLKLRRDI